METLQHKATLAEFLTWEDSQRERYEFFRGDTYVKDGDTARHNRVVLNLASRIGEHLDGTECQVFAASMKVQIAEGVLYPDLVVTCAKATAGDEKAVADPTLIIEVLTQGANGYDKREKFNLYRTLASLREYVLIDPEKQEVEVFALAPRGEWVVTNQTGADMITLASIDCPISMHMAFKGVTNAQH